MTHFGKQIDDILCMTIHPVRWCLEMDGSSTCLLVVGISAFHPAETARLLACPEA